MRTISGARASIGSSRVSFWALTPRFDRSFGEAEWELERVTFGEDLPFALAEEVDLLPTDYLPRRAVADHRGVLVHANEHLTGRKRIDDERAGAWNPHVDDVPVRREQHIAHEAEPRRPYRIEFACVRVVRPFREERDTGAASGERQSAAHRVDERAPERGLSEDRGKPGGVPAREEHQRSVVQPLDDLVPVCVVTRLQRHDLRVDPERREVLQAPRSPGVERRVALVRRRGGQHERSATRLRGALHQPSRDRLGPRLELPRTEQREGSSRHAAPSLSWA